MKQNDFGLRMTLFEGRITETVTRQLSNSTENFDQKNTAFVKEILSEIAKLVIQHEPPVTAESTSTALVAHKSEVEGFSSSSTSQ
jgi:hypothetical protein